MNLIRGAKLGPYEIESPLGAGGMGEVYRALDTRLWGAALLILAAILAWFSFGRPVDRSNPYSLDIVPSAGGRVRSGRHEPIVVGIATP